MLADVDAAAIRMAEPRGPTQAIAAWLYEQSAPDGSPLGGARSTSRHGGGVTLWAVFERPGDDEVSALVRAPKPEPIDEGDPSRARR